MMGARQQRLMVAIPLAAALPACGPALIFEHLACADASECPETWRCVAESCVPTCGRDDECPAGHLCRQGACEPTAGDECAADADCATPGQCQTAAGAICAAGTCAYPPTVDAGCDDLLACTSLDRCSRTGVCAGIAAGCVPCGPSAPCAGALACVDGSCASGCQDFTHQSCADPVGAYCLDDACAPRRGLGEDCRDGAQCHSGVCTNELCASG